MLQRLAQFTDIRVALVVGGLSQQVQAATLRSSPEIIVATPVSTLHANLGLRHVLNCIDHLVLGTLQV